MTSRSQRSIRSAVLTLVLAGCALSLLGAPAWAAGPGAGWEVASRAIPTNLVPGHKGVIEVAVFNTGAESSSGEITVTDTLPPGVTATDAGEPLNDHFPEEATVGHSQWDCTGIGSGVVTCESNLAGLPEIEGGAGTGVPTSIIDIAVQVAPGVAEGAALNGVSVAGGSALGAASSADTVTISSTPAVFGITGFDGWFSNADGTLDTQSGSHPYALTFNIAFPLTLNKQGEQASPGGKEPRVIAVGLPPGVIGDTDAVRQCTQEELEKESCPGGSQVGIMYPKSPTIANSNLMLFNMVPPPGIPAEFGGLFASVPVRLDVGVRSGGDYGVTTFSNNTKQTYGLQYARVSLWGVPGDPSHNHWRSNNYFGCPEGAPPSGAQFCQPPESHPRAFLTLPVACEGPQPFSIFANTWQDPSLTAEASFRSHDANGLASGLGGCEHLTFDPSIATALDTARVNTPAGLTVDVHFSLEGLTEPEKLMPSDMKDVTVTLPEGLVVNPGQANGLVACQETETSLKRKPDGEENNGPASCPAASRVGTAKIRSPLLEADPEKEVEGSVYLLQSNPPDLRLLIAGSADGVNIKVVGTVHLDERTGRLTATFKNTPQLPSSDIRLTFNGGPGGALITPRACGAYTTNTDFTPWSTPYTPDATPSAQFGVSEGVGGGACPSGEPFSPSMIAGMVSNQAGGFSPLSVTLSRRDSEQDASSISVTTPPGLLAMLKSAERCGEPQASQGACGPNSLIGHTTVAVGAGPDPFVVHGGQVFLTGPYRGAPFGLSVVVPALAGPFDLGNVVVRAAIGIDPHTAQPTIVSDPLPRILDGVPLQIQTINVTVDREGFMFNPTNCQPLALTGIVTSTHGVSAPVSSRYQAANCTALPFKPSFKVSTQAKTSKKGGASLDVKVGSGAGQANIGKVAVALPKALPSRLTTIQQACTEAAFNANPASCPVGSNIGMATARTPMLMSSLVGPAYLVSHGGAAFPDLVIVLQGEGITLDLLGSIDIKKGVTSSAFNAVPDAPISSFELSLPEGPHSALAAVVPAKKKGNLCGTSLTMPTTLTGQNGAVVKQSTRISVTGCPKAKKKAKHHKKVKRG